jgi:protein-tyrosine kinase
MSRLFEALQQFESETTGAQFTWPHLRAPASKHFKTELDAELERCQSILINPSEESRLVGLTAKDGLGAEKFRFLAVRLRQMNQVRAIQKLLITSTMPEEGKSFVSANLAIAFAHRHVQKILLLDGDLRRPALAQQFGLGHLPGICEWLQGHGSVDGNIYHLKNAGFWFLPAGNTPDNPLELMQSVRLPQLFDELARHFDWIIIDSPPLLPLGDTSVWIRAADGMLLVVREGKSQVSQINAGMQAVRPKNLLGVVLNSCSSVDRSNYYQRYYSNSVKQPSPPEATLKNDALSVVPNPER